ncbi:MAG: zinc ribbon domain-containing protein, partial [Aquificales bacterium]|nr:zinc ribbon domain-containing protein [Aquificales bacterium]
MPVYEYRCQDCHRLVRLTFTFSEYGKAKPVCSFCESKNLTRR